MREQAQAREGRKYGRNKKSGSVSEEICRGMTVLNKQSLAVMGR